MPRNPVPRDAATFPISLLVQSLPPGGGVEFCSACAAGRTPANAEAALLLALYVSREISYDISLVKPEAFMHPERARAFECRWCSTGGTDAESICCRRDGRGVCDDHSRAGATTGRQVHARLHQPWPPCA